MAFQKHRLTKFKQATDRAALVCKSLSYGRSIIHRHLRKHAPTILVDSGAQEGWQAPSPIYDMKKTVRRVPEDNPGTWTPPIQAFVRTIARAH